LRRTVLAAAALMLTLMDAASAQTIRLGTDGAYQPWNFLDSDGRVVGFEIELGNELCARAGLTCEWVISDWTSMIPSLQAGNFDAIMAGMSITDERRQAIDFSQNYFPADPRRFVAAAGASFDFDNLVGMRIGAQRGTILNTYVDQHFATGNTIKTYETIDQAMADLVGGNLDMVLADPASVERIVDGSADIAFVGPEVLVGDGVGVGLRKQDDDLEAKLNAAIDEVKKDGSLDALIAKWFEGRGPFFSN
jgi:polar amino acid transport system substrate-binding protein